jgi:Protein of unknown function (DUF664)
VKRAPQPGNSGERQLLLGWLAFHRDALEAKCAGLSGRQLVARPAGPSALSLLGLVRHMTEMEHVYLVHALAGGQPLRLIYCTDEKADADFANLRPSMARSSLKRWLEVRARADALLTATGPLGGLTAGNRHSVRWNLIKLIQEYARHNGHADLLRELIDGTAGE